MNIWVIGKAPTHTYIPTHIHENTETHRNTHTYTQRLTDIYILDSVKDHRLSCSERSFVFQLF